MRRRVFVDTNFIITAHEVKLWKVLASSHDIETVETCVEECHTGCQRRNPETWIDHAALIASLHTAPHSVNEELRSELHLLERSGTLDRGEFDLWAYMLTVQEDIWFLSGPDKASMNFGLKHGFKDRLISLEELLPDNRIFKKKNVGSQYSKSWLSARKVDFEMGHLKL